MYVIVQMNTFECDMHLGLSADRAGGCNGWLASHRDMIPDGVVLQATVDGLFQV